MNKHLLFSYRKVEKKPKNKLRRLLLASSLAVCSAPNLLANPSQFAVYAAVRRAVLTRWKHLYAHSSEHSDDSDNEDQATQTPLAKLPKVGILL